LFGLSPKTSLHRKIGGEGFFVNTKAGSRERGAAWLNVASEKLLSTAALRS